MGWQRQGNAASPPVAAPSGPVNHPNKHPPPSTTPTPVRFNPAEPDVFATAGSDRGVALYDLRSSTPIRKLVMQTRTNALAWNPMEAFNFTGGRVVCVVCVCVWRPGRAAPDSARPQ